MTGKEELKNLLLTLEVTDQDLPPAYRTSANMWKAEYLIMHQELRRANKGLMRLHRKVVKLEDKLKQLGL